jgi:hypothetical protein
MKRSLANPALFLPVLVALTSAVAFPQSSILKKGQSGLGLTGAYAANSGVSGLMGTAGVSLGGIFDVSFSLAGAKFKPGQNEFSDLRSTALSPQFTAHVIKQNSSRSPVSVAVSIGYARDNYRSPDLAAAELNAYANSFAVGGTVYRDVRLSGRLYLQPYAGLTHTSSTLKITDAIGITLSSHDTLVSFRTGLPVVYGLSEKAWIVVEPGLTFDKDHTTFAVSAGLVLALNRPKA